MKGEEAVDVGDCQFFAGKDGADGGGGVGDVFDAGVEAFTPVRPSLLDTEKGNGKEETHFGLQS